MHAVARTVVLVLVLAACGGRAELGGTEGAGGTNASAACQTYDDCRDHLGNRLESACGTLGPVVTILPPDDPACLDTFEAYVICMANAPDAVQCDQGNGRLSCDACEAEGAALRAACPGYGSCG